ncbi:MAG: hypothetical protein ACLR8T_12900 [Alistipes finegoldii]|jgi:hypothetical protein
MIGTDTLVLMVVLTCTPVYTPRQQTAFERFKSSLEAASCRAKAEATRQTSARYDEIVRGVEKFRHTMDSILRPPAQAHKRMNEHLKKYGNGD